MQELRLAVRSLRATPILSIVAALSLALGIGANSAIFSLVNSLLLRPLAVTAPERLVTVSSALALSNGFTAGLGWNYGMWHRFAERTGEFDGAFAWTAAGFDLSEGGEIESATGVFASGDFFTTLGVPALFGRTFSRADDVRGGGPDGAVAVISHAFWQRRFGGADNIIDTRLAIDGVPFTIVGVTPPAFLGIDVGQPFDIAVPLLTEPLVRGKRTAVDSERSFFLGIVLRLKPEQTIEGATATIRAMQLPILGLAGEQLASLPAFLSEPYVLVPAATGTADRSGLRRQYRFPLLAMLVIVALVLVITCANVANLLLARATTRRLELSIRVALGASRWRLARQLFVESLVLAGAGGAIGWWLAWWGSRLLLTQISTEANRVVLDLSLDWRMLAFTASVTLVTAVVFGTAPAWRATRVAPIDALKEQGRASGSSAGRGFTLSNGLVVAQVALSLVLVVAAGLFVGTFRRLANVPLGFESDRVLVVDVDTSRASVDPTGRLPFYQRLVSAIDGIPGVAGVAGSAITPLGGGSQAPLFNQPGMVMEHFVTPRWFAVYGTAVRAGRDVDQRDGPNAPPVVVVNEAFVRRFFPGKAVIGQRVEERSCGRLPWLERDRGCVVVGVVADAVFGSPRGGMKPTIYLPLAQTAALRLDRASFSISVRALASQPARLAPSIRGVLNGIDPALAFSFRPLEADVQASLRQERLVALLSGLFGLLAQGLAALGLYGVTSYAVSCRRGEIGIRLALGGRPSGIVRLVVARVSMLVGAGLALGTGASLWLSQFVASLLYGVQPRDGSTLLGATISLALVVGIAATLPAYRASLLDPADVLRRG